MSGGIGYKRKKLKVVSRTAETKPPVTDEIARGDDTPAVRHEREVKAPLCPRATLYDFRMAYARSVNMVIYCKAASASRRARDFTISGYSGFKKHHQYLAPEGNEPSFYGGSW
jgi:hypothetical protein